MSKFVSSGTDQEPTERDSEWLEAQKAVEAKHLAKLEAGKQRDGKSLYETLQANKDAKQEAFEDSIRLRNQFRSLNDDEVEFLDSIAEAERSKEADIRREARAQLESFKVLQQEAEKASKQPMLAAEQPSNDSWAAAPRKRKRGTELSGIVKKRQLPAKIQASTEESSPLEHPVEAKQTSQTISANQPAKVSTAATQQKPFLGLAEYSSDED